jgi:hypothetical protein
MLSHARKLPKILVSPLVSKSGVSLCWSGTSPPDIRDFRSRLFGRRYS